MSVRKGAYIWCEDGKPAYTLTSSVLMQVVIGSERFRVLELHLFRGKPSVDEHGLADDGSYDTVAVAHLAGHDPIRMDNRCGFAMYLFDDAREAGVPVHEHTN